MICIYDFDGTLTPYSLPQYPILKQCGCTDLILMNRVEKIMSEGLNFYEAYYKCYRDVLEENGIKMSRANICSESENTFLNAWHCVIIIYIINIIF